MSQRMLLLRRVTRHALPTLGVALLGCESTRIVQTSFDRILPTIAVKIQGTPTAEKAAGDSVNIRVPLNIDINAQDNAALLSVQTRIFVDTTLVKRDSAVFPLPSTTYTRSVPVPLVGVRAGQRIRVSSMVLDGAGNVATAEATAIAYDPAIPRVSFDNPDNTVIVGGTYQFTIKGSDSLGVAKLGYRTTGLPGNQKSDSALMKVPYPTNTTHTFSLTIPSNATGGSTFTVEPFAENRDGLRGSGAAFSVRIASLGADTQHPLVYQTVPTRFETGDSLDVTARDPDGTIRVMGFIARDSAGKVVHTRADTLTSLSQLVTRRIAINAPIVFRGKALAITAFATDGSGKTGWAVPTGALIPVTADSVAKRDQSLYVFGTTTALPDGSLGADLLVDTARSRVYVSNITRNELAVWSQALAPLPFGGFSSRLGGLTPVAVGAQPWGMTVDNSGSILFVANSGGTNISKVDLDRRIETGRVKTTNEWIYDVSYTFDEATKIRRFKVSSPIDYSDRPQYVAQAASGALYYSTRPTKDAEAGTLRRIDDYRLARSEPRQIWQYGGYSNGHYVVVNADYVEAISGGQDFTDSLRVCDHTPGNDPSTAVCVTDAIPENAQARLRALVQSNVDVGKDLSVASLALTDTTFVAVGGDRRRVAFGEANTEGSGRVLLVYDPAGTQPFGEIYNQPIDVKDLTNNASDKVYGIDINKTSSNIGVHGVETFFADSSLRLQGKFATFTTGAGIAFHPGNDDDLPRDSTARVVFVASGDMSIQIVDSYSYRLRGRIPLRKNLYGPLRAMLPSKSDAERDPSVVVKLFGLTTEGIVVIDVRKTDIDNVLRR